MNPANMGTSGACLGMHKGQLDESHSLSWQDPKQVTAALSNFFTADGISQMPGAIVLCHSLSRGQEWLGWIIVIHSFSCTAQLIFSLGPLM